jgi:hypothetical protein
VHCMQYRCCRHHVLLVLCNVGRYKEYLLAAFRSDPHGNLQDRDGQPPQNSRANAQRTPDWARVTTAAEAHVPASPLAAWPPGRGGIRRPKRPSSHCGAGPGCTTVGREPKTPLASLGGPCETSTLATLVRRLEKPSHSPAPPITISHQAISPPSAATSQWTHAANSTCSRTDMQWKVESESDSQPCREIT